MNHTVSLQDKDSWITMAQFLFYADAMHYARWLSETDMHGRNIRIETNDVANTWFRNGIETANWTKGGTI